MQTYNEFCKNKQCPEYIEWSFGMGSHCTSCKLVGQSCDIDEYPDNCLFIDEIKNSDVVKTMIANDMASKTVMSVLSVDITDVQEQ